MRNCTVYRYVKLRDMCTFKAMPSIRCRDSPNISIGELIRATKEWSATMLVMMIVRAINGRSGLLISPIIIIIKSRCPRRHHHPFAYRQLHVKSQMGPRSTVIAMYPQQSIHIPLPSTRASKRFGLIILVQSAS